MQAIDADEQHMFIGLARLSGYSPTVDECGRGDRKNNGPACKCGACMT
jgi:hypothetical protein